MKAYNQKIIETPTYLEIYDYEAIITPKQKADKNETNIYQISHSYSPLYMPYFKFWDTVMATSHKRS